jgi:hypothetical protein
VSSHELGCGAADLRSAYSSPDVLRSTSWPYAAG